MAATEEGADKELAAIISEYLNSRGYLQSVATFQTESRRKPKRAPPTQTTGLQRDFIVAFECGKREAFFKLWNQNVPREMLERDSMCQNLEFNLSVYFAIYPTRTGTGDRTRSLSQFTDYLSTRNSVLSKSPELSAYCALPYIPDPTSHPTFKKLFTESWGADIKSRLVHFLKLSLTGSPSQPKLLSLYLANKVSLTTAGSVQEVILLRDQLAETRRQYSERLAEIQDSYHTLVGIALELLDGLESAIAGRQVTPESIQSICSRLFSSSLAAEGGAGSVGDIRPSTASSILRQSFISMRDNLQAPSLHTSTPLPSPLPPSSPPSPTSPDTTLTQPIPTQRQIVSSKTTPPNYHQTTPPRHYRQLDYQRVKGVLQSGNHKQKALLFQALRWRLTKAVSAQDSHAVMQDYITNDLLGCSNESDTYHVTVTSFLQSSSSSPVLREQFCRLLNAVSSLSQGRSYLAQSHYLVTALCQLLASLGGGGGGGEEGEGVTGGGVEGIIGRNALGAIQKLSLKRQLQEQMVGCGLPQWVAMVIGSGEGETPPLSDYVLRYVLALLMNLSLRRCGREACLGVGPLLLRSLGELLEHEDEEICSYVNGILYSLLSIPQLQQEARAMGMGDMLTSALEASPPELKSQLHYIISKLNSDTPTSSDPSEGGETPPTNNDSEDEEEEEEEEDGDVIEGDEDEVAIATSGPMGESLLAQYEIDGTLSKDQQQPMMSSGVTTSQSTRQLSARPK